MEKGAPFFYFLMLDMIHDAVRRNNGTLQSDIHCMYVHEASYYAYLAIKCVEQPPMKNRNQPFLWKRSLVIIIVS